MERSGNFYKAIRLGYILISILIGCMAYNSLYEWQEIEALELGNKKIDELRKEINNINIQMIKFSLLGETIPQLQEIAGKVWKKEDELKQLKSELAALDRKIQLELAPPTPEVAEKENEGQQLKPEAEDVRNRQAQYPENAPPQIRSPADSIVANHVIIGRPGLYAKEETRSKGLKI